MTTLPALEEPAPPPPARSPGIGTGQRFFLLTVVMFWSSLALAYATLVALHSAAGRAHCEALDEQGISCDRSSFLWAQAGGTALWLVLLIVCAVVTAVVTPWVRGLRARLVPVTDQEVHAYLRRLVRRAWTGAGTRADVRFVVDVRALGAGASATARFRHPVTVSLHAGLLARRTSRPRVFDAVVLHELAHLRAGDVQSSRLAVAEWRVFALGAGLPYLAVQVWLMITGSAGSWPEDRPSAAKLIVVLVLVVLVYLGYADLLRHRELSADLDAVHWGADPGVWRDAARAPSVAAGRRTYRGALAAWAAWPWRTHPGWALRHRTLLVPRTGAVLTAAVFIALTIAMAVTDWTVIASSDVFGPTGQVPGFVFLLYVWQMVLGPLFASRNAPPARGARGAGGARPTGGAGGTAPARGAPAVGGDGSTGRARASGGGRGMKGTRGAPGPRAPRAPLGPRGGERQETRRRPVVQRAGREVSAWEHGELLRWLDRGGTEAARRTIGALTAYRNATGTARPGPDAGPGPGSGEGTGWDRSTETTAHAWAEEAAPARGRAAVTTAVAAGHALPDVPHPRGHELWSLFLDRAQAAADGLYELQVDLAHPAARPVAAYRCRAARRAYRSFRDLYSQLPDVTERLPVWPAPQTTAGGPHA